MVSPLHPTPSEESIGWIWTIGVCLCPSEKGILFLSWLSFFLFLTFTSCRFILLAQMTGSLQLLRSKQIKQTLNTVSFWIICTPRAYVFPLHHSGHILTGFHGKALHIKHCLHSCRISWGILTRKSAHPLLAVIPASPGSHLLKLPLLVGRSLSASYLAPHPVSSLFSFLLGLQAHDH